MPAHDPQEPNSPAPAPDIIRPPTPAENPEPDRRPEIPTPGPDIVTPPEPIESPQPAPPEAPQQPG
ncbi:hypothetical protein DFR50_12071 [Roseiarcus fermentans]|uniref:Uncharacterized protein n=1 Tax=Roseiarcus fermentans TaxID=1473586 RepID=A0A366F5F1_9HYPH|nr:hypothetical protein DFR50_12071 [Roseiarcus fermentans]